MIDYSKKTLFGGEWSVYECSFNNKINIMDGDYVVADIVSPVGVDYKNARLIAAAPELLRELIDRYQQHYCGCGHPSCNRCEDDRCTGAVLNKTLGGNDE